MTDPFFRFRITQIGRVLREGGWRLWIALPALALLVVTALLRLTLLHPLFFQGLLAAALIWVHKSRKDAFFLRLLGRRAQWYVAVEYAVWALPLEVFFWMRYEAPGRFWSFLGLAVIAVLFFVPGGKASRRKSIFEPVRRITGRLPVALYEWKAVLRRFFPIVLLLYALTLLALSRVPLAGVSLLVLALLFSGNLEWNAPPEVHLASDKDLLKKLLRNGVFLTLLALPLVGVQVVQYPHLEETVFLLFCFVVAQVLCFYFLLLPLAAFPEPLSAAQRVFAPLLFCIAAPLLPLSLYLLYQKYRQAQWALQPYWS